MLKKGQKLHILQKIFFEIFTTSSSTAVLEKFAIDKKSQKKQEKTKNEKKKKKKSK